MYKPNFSRGLVVNFILKCKYLYFQVVVQQNSKAMSLKLIFLNQLPPSPALPPKGLWHAPSPQVRSTVSHSSFFSTASAGLSTYNSSRLHVSFDKATRSDHSFPYLVLLEAPHLHCSGILSHSWGAIKITAQIFTCINFRAWQHTWWAGISGTHTKAYTCAYTHAHIYTHLYF